MKTLYALIVIPLLAACSEDNSLKHNPAFDLPDALYSAPDYDDENAEILHPAGYLSRLNTSPQTQCDREALRQLVIALNMYSYDMMNQSYYLETDTDGAKILLETFPKLKELTGEGDRVISIDKMSDHLRTVKFGCD